MGIKRTILGILLSASTYMIGNANPHRFPMEKVPFVDGEYIMFSSTPIPSDKQIPLSIREFAEYTRMHKVPALPPYYTSLTGYVINPGAERLDSVVIASENGGGGKVVLCYDSLGYLANQTIKDGPNVYAEIKIKRNEKHQEIERDIEYRNGDQMIYKLASGKPTHYELNENKRTTEKISWAYKNSMPFTATASSSSDGKISATFTYTPQKRVESIKMKKDGNLTTTLFEFSDYESSVYAPIVYKLNEKASKEKPYDIFTYYCKDNGDTYLRENKVANRNIYKMKGLDKEPILTASISYESYANGMEGGAKNMINRIVVKDKNGNIQRDEQFSYYPDLRMKAISSIEFGEITYIYNKDGNVKLIMITQNGVQRTIHFYYTNFEEERQRLEAERLAREAEEAAKAAEAENSTEGAGSVISEDEKAASTDKVIPTDETK